MPIAIGRSLGEGFERTVSRNGGILIVAWAVLVAVSLPVWNAFFAGVSSGSRSQAMLIGPTPDLSPAVAGAAGVLVYLLSFVLMTGAVRTFVTDNTRTLPRRHFTRNLGRTLLNLVVGYIAFFLAIWIGFVLLVIPGLYLLVSLFLWFVLVVIEDRNAIDAFRTSWSLATGNRWRLLAIGVIVTVSGWVFMAIPMAAAAFLPSVVAVSLYAVAVSIYGVFSLATAARVYVQIADGARAD